MTEKVIKAWKYFKDENYRFMIRALHGKYESMPDEEYLKKMYLAKKGVNLDLNQPKTFNEKLQWLKLHDRNPEYTVMVDKAEVKPYVSDKVGEKYIIPTLGIWNRAEDIDFSRLPQQFVLKCTHDSHKIVICKDKTKLDMSKAREKLRKGLKQDYYSRYREWPYKGVQPRIIAEQYMCDRADVPLDKQELTDYKFYCFNGAVECVMVCYDRANGDTKYYFFDKDWQLKRINRRGMEAPKNFTLQKPECLNEMIWLAETLSERIPFVRVDLYQCQNHPYFGELTFYPQSGFDPNYLPETDAYFGSLIDLSLAYDRRCNLNQ